MLKVLLTIYFAFRSAFKSQSQLEAEIVSLRHQLNIALRRRSCRVQLSNFDRSFLVGISRAFPTVLESVKVVRPETVTRWHRQGVRRYWRWRSPGLRLGRPKIDKELRDLIQRMCRENPLRVCVPKSRFSWELGKTRMRRPTQPILWGDAEGPTDDLFCISERL